MYGKVNEQLDIFSVEKLLTELVSSKGTGRDRPGEGAVFVVEGGKRESVEARQSTDPIAVFVHCIDCELDFLYIYTCRSTFFTCIEFSYKHDS